MITTANMRVDPELCRRLDQAKHVTPDIQMRVALIRSELLDYIRTYDAELSNRFAANPCNLYRLYIFADRVRMDYGEFVNERMQANAHTAHEQLKNWK